MGRKQRDISAYRSMWLFAMFDLPVNSPEARRDYTRFRKAILRQGFTMLQFSVYARFCDSEERADVFRRRLRVQLPPHGEVRFLAVTDCQFGKMEVYYGKKRAETEKPPEQLVLF